MRSASSFVALAAVLGALVAANGCSSVTTTVPIGEPANIAETKQFVGTWVGPDGDVSYVRHAGDNRLRVASMAWDQKKREFRVASSDCLITKDEDQLYGNLLKRQPEGDRPAEAAPSYNFGRLMLSSPDQLLVTAPKDETFAQAVRDGTIAGHMEESGKVSSIRLEPTAQQLADFVTPSKVAEQFLLEDPLVLRRIRSVEAQYP